MPDQIQIQAYGKINLALNVTAQRTDGYHEVAMILQSVSLHDTLTLKKSSAHHDTLLCGSDAVSSGPDNLILQTAQVLRQETGCGYVDAVLEKRIPVAAGMAGGSSDAAAMLSGMNDLFELGLAEPELLDLSSQIGSDVPFCLSGGTCLSQGRGEILTRLPDLPQTELVIVKPDFGVSTPWAYHAFDESVPVAPADLAAMQEELGRPAFSARAFFRLMRNQLEGPVMAAYPLIEEIRGRILSEGATAARMSGSGPSVFGVFASDGPDGGLETCAAADAAKENLKKIYPSCEVLRAKTVTTGLQKGILS